MDEKTLLEAIGEMLDDRDQRMSEMMDAKLEPIKQDLTEVKERVTKIEIHQENVTDKNIQLLLEGQQGMNEKFQKLDQVAEDVEEIKIKVSAMEESSKTQASQIQALRIAK